MANHFKVVQIGPVAASSIARAFKLFLSFLPTPAVGDPYSNLVKVYEIGSWPNGVFQITKTILRGTREGDAGVPGSSSFIALRVLPYSDP